MEKAKNQTNRLYSENEKELAANLDKIMGALGLAMNAGGLAVGGEAVVQAVNRGKARIVFITKDISAGSLEKLIAKLSLTDTKYIILPCSKEYMAQRLGKSGLTTSAALIKSGFEKIIFKCMNTAINNTVKLNNTTEVQ